MYANDSHLARIDLEDWVGFASGRIVINRRNAMAVSTVAAGRNKIAGTGGRLALYAEQGGTRVPQPQQPALLGQPEKGVASSTTMSWLFDDLIFHPYAWWVVMERDSYKWPRWVRRIAPGDANTDSTGSRLESYLDDAGRTVPVNPADVIRFDSPLGNGLLANAAKTIRRALALDLAAANAEDNPVPSIELHNEGEDLEPDQAKKLVDDWRAARQAGGVAYTPKNLKANVLGQIPQQLLIDGRRAISLDLIRHLNIPPWAAATAIEGGDLTYDNRQLRNFELIDLTLAPYFAAITGRLSLSDVTPRGWQVKFDTDDLTRDDIKTRFDTYSVGLAGDFIDRDWIAAQEGWPAAMGGNA